MYITTIANRNSPPAVLLRESYREQGKVKSRTLANLSSWPEAKIGALRRVLADEPMQPAATQRFEIEGRTTTSTFMVMPPEVGGGLHLQQALARYSYNAETVIGMIERSTAQDQVTS